VRLPCCMTATTPGHLIDIAGPTFERRCAGQDAVLFCRGLAVASFRQGDSIGRDICIAILLRVGRGLKTDTIAELCDASHGGVCEVRRRLAEGGLARVVERARRGAPRKVVGIGEERLRTMHADGASVREIAEAVGVSKSLIATEIKRLELSPRAQQKVLPRMAPATASEMAPALLRQATAPDGSPSVEEMSDETSAPSQTSAPEETVVDVVEMAVEALVPSEEGELSAVELVAGAPLVSGPAEPLCGHAAALRCGLRARPVLGARRGLRGSASRGGVRRAPGLRGPAGRVGCWVWFARGDARA
jgi:transposase